MNNRGLSELRRRLNPDYRNPTELLGCFVDREGKVLTSFRQDIIHLTEGDNAMYMTLFKKVLSGTMGQNLQDVEFTADQVLNGEEYKLMRALRDSGMKDEDAVKNLFQRIVEAIPSLKQDEGQSVRAAQEGVNYLILLLYDAYDVPFRDINGEKDADRGTEMFNYLLCCICPVKQTKPALIHTPHDGMFHEADLQWAVSAPELGFLYPQFEERAADIYRALFYTRTPDTPRDAFVRSIFNAEATMPAQEQSQTFNAVLEDSLQEECSLEVIQAVHETVSERIEAQKADKNAEPLCLGPKEVRQVLTECGITEEKAETFEKKYEEAFGAAAEIPAVNLVQPKKFNVSTPNVQIKVDPAFSNLLETRVIDGKRYIMVLADGDVEVNGVRIQ